MNDVVPIPNRLTRRHATLIGLAAMLVAVCAGCGRENEAPSRDIGVRQEITATSFPAASIARRIVGDHVPVHCPAPTGVPPETYRPSPEAIERTQRSRLIVVSGAGLEPWVRLVSLPRSRTVELSAGFDDRLLTVESAVTHSHGIGGEHTHRGPDGYVWLDPDLAAEQARAMHREASAAFPQHAEVFSRNLQALIDELADLSERLDAIAPYAQDKVIRADAPVYNYLGRRLGVTIVTNGLPSDGDLVLVDRAGATVYSGDGVVPFPVHAEVPEDATLDLFASLSHSLARLEEALGVR
ncbi:MAG: metal ABC transporter substrate-binding protein [Phycisphaerales bacterium]